jgi:MATE family multidrug resistance protein
MSRWVREMADLWRLAVPVIVARAGIMTMALVDTVMVARFSAEELAFQSIANAVTGAVLTTLLGLLLGTLVMSARAYGAERYEEAGAVWRRAVGYAVAMGVVGGAFCASGEALLALFGQTPEIAAGGGRVMLIFGLSVPAALVTIATTFFLEGIRRPVPGMVVTLFGNVVNLALNWVFVWGHLGFPAMGAAGSALATAGVRFAMMLALLAYVWWMPGHAAFGVRRPRPWRWRAGAEQRRVGYGGAVSIGVETAAFGGLSVLAGWLGVLPLAATSMVFNVVATIFMVALGLASATGVRVGIAAGRRDPAGIARAGWTGLGAVAAAMALFGLGLAAFPEAIARFYTDDAALLATAAPLIALCALLLVPDGGQVVMAHALRGRGDNLGTTLLHICSYLLLMLPLSWALAFPAGYGAAGLWLGAIVASVFSVLVLSWRFLHLNAAARRWLTREESLGRNASDGRGADRPRASAT